MEIKETITDTMRSYAAEIVMHYITDETKKMLLEKLAELDRYKAKYGELDETL